MIPASTLTIHYPDIVVRKITLVIKLIERFHATVTRLFSKIRGSNTTRENLPPMASKRSSEKDVAVSASAGLAPARRKASTQPRARRAVATPETPAPEATVILSSTAVTISFEPTHEDIASLAY